MRKVLACVLLAVAGLAQPVEVPPRVVFVAYETPTEVVLWDPEEAQLLGYVFRITDGPRHGTLTGELPTLVYTPAPGFYGTDRVHFVVEDPLGRYGMGVVGIVVLPAVGLAETRAPTLPTLAGGVRTGLDLAGQPAQVSLASSEAVLYSKFQHFEQELRAAWGGAGLTSVLAITRLSLVAPGAVPLNIPVSMSLRFDPTAVALASADVQASGRLGAFYFSFLANYIGPNPATSVAVLNLSSSLGGLTVQGRYVWRILPLEFSELTVRASGPAAAFGCPNCPFRIDASFTFSKRDGLRDLLLTVRHLPLPCPACTVLKALLDVEIRFTPQSKTVRPLVRLEGAWGVCLKPFVELVPAGPGPGWGGLAVYGVEVKCDLPGGYGLRSATSFDDARNAAITGDARFFEVWQLYGPLATCCGPQGRWQIGAYFRRTGGGVLGMALHEAQLHLPITAEWAARVVAKFGQIDPVDPAKVWTLAVELSGLLGP